MTTLFVLRHGKSDWRASYETDHLRPLAERGVAAAQQMGRFVSASGQVPERVISSSAVRARTTAELAIAAGQWQCPAVYTDALYGASVASVIDLVRSEKEATSSLLLVGHQPTWSELISDLVGGATVHFPTAALARIDFATDRWVEIASASGTLRWLVTPKLLEKL